MADGNIIEFPIKPSKRTFLSKFILHFWESGRYWGALGVYDDLDDAQNDAILLMEDKDAGFSKFRIDSIPYVEADEYN